MSFRPYADKIRNVVAHVANANTEYKHPYLTGRDVKRIGVILVTTDRGLCGGLNGNLFRNALRQSKAWEEEGTEPDLCTIGSKGSAFFNRIGGNIVQEDGSFEDPSNVAINKRVEVRMIDLGDGMALPQWKLSGEPSADEKWQVPAP